MNRLLSALFILMTCFGCQSQTEQKEALQVGAERLCALERSTGCNRAPLALVVNVDSLEMRLLACNRLASALVGRGVHDDSDVPNGRMKLACHKFPGLVVVNLEPVGRKSLFHARTPRRLWASALARERVT